MLHPILDTMSSTQPETRTLILQATWKLMEQRRGQGVSMSDIAQATGVSRQTVYLHFGNRADLLIATTHYIDNVLGLDVRLAPTRTAQTGIEQLDRYIRFWGEYLPLVYGVAKSLLIAQETDPAAAAALRDRMAAVREGCAAAVSALARDGRLATEWTVSAATDILWTLLSVRNWEHLTIDCGHSSDEYVVVMQTLIKRALVRNS